jgi:hypothetical protein
MRMVPIEYQNYVFNVYGNLFKSWNFILLGNHYGRVGYLSSAALGTNFISIYHWLQGRCSIRNREILFYNWSNIHFALIVMALNHIGSDMYNWLQNDLASSNDGHVYSPSQ